MSAKELQEKTIQKLKLCCENEQNFQKHSAYLIEKANCGDEKFVKPIVDTIKKIIKDSKEPALKKFYALLLLKECMEIGNKSLLAYVIKKILDRLKKLARKANEGEGKLIFGSKPSDPTSCSNFSQLLLECICEWAVKYAMSGNSIDPTKYKLAYNELIKKVKFPQKNIYFQKKKEGISQSQPPQKPDSKNKPLNASLASNQVSKKPEETKEELKMPTNFKKQPDNEKISISQKKDPINPVSNTKKINDYIEKITFNKMIIINATDMILQFEDVDNETIESMTTDLLVSCKYFVQLNLEELLTFESVPEIERSIKDVFNFIDISNAITKNYDKFKKKLIAFKEFKSVLRIELDKINSPVTNRQPKLEIKIDNKREIKEKNESKQEISSSIKSVEKPPLKKISSKDNIPINEITKTDKLDSKPNNIPENFSQFEKKSSKSDFPQFERKNSKSDFNPSFDFKKKESISENSGFNFGIERKQSEFDKFEKNNIFEGFNETTKAFGLDNSQKAFDFGFDSKPGLAFNERKNSNSSIQTNNELKKIGSQNNFNTKIQDKSMDNGVKSVKKPEIFSRSNSINNANKEFDFNFKKNDEEIHKVDNNDFFGQLNYQTNFIENENVFSKNNNKTDDKSSRQSIKSKEHIFEGFNQFNFDFGNETKNQSMAIEDNFQNSSEHENANAAFNFNFKNFEISPKQTYKDHSISHKNSIDEPEKKNEWEENLANPKSTNNKQENNNFTNWENQNKNPEKIFKNNWDFNGNFAFDQNQVKNEFESQNKDNLIFVEKSHNDEWDSELNNPLKNIKQNSSNLNEKSKEIDSKSNKNWDNDYNFDKKEVKNNDFDFEPIENKSKNNFGFDFETEHKHNAKNNLFFDFGQEQTNSYNFPVQKLNKEKLNVLSTVKNDFENKSNFNDKAETISQNNINNNQIDINNNFNFSNNNNDVFYTPENQSFKSQGFRSDNNNPNINNLNIIDTKSIEEDAEQMNLKKNKYPFLNENQYIMSTTNNLNQIPIEKTNDEWIDFTEDNNSTIPPIKDQSNLNIDPNYGFNIINNKQKEIDFLKSQKVPVGSYQYPTINPMDFNQNIIDGLKEENNFIQNNQNNINLLEWSSPAIKIPTQENKNEFIFKDQNNINNSLNNANSVMNLYKKPSKSNFENSQNNSILNEDKNNNYTQNAMNLFEKNISSKLVNQNFKIDNIEWEAEKQQLLNELQTTKQMCNILKENLEKSEKKIELEEIKSINTPYFAPPLTFIENKEKTNLIVENETLKQTIEQLATELNTIKQNSISKIETPGQSPIKGIFSPLKEMSLNQYSSSGEAEIHRFYTYKTIFRKNSAQKKSNVFQSNNNVYTMEVKSQNNLLGNYEHNKSLNSSFFTYQINKKLDETFDYIKGPNKSIFQSTIYKNNQFFNDKPSTWNQKPLKKNNKIYDYNEKFLINLLEKTDIKNSELNIDNFKYSCLNQRGILFENENMQLGSISTKTNHKQIRISLFVGNKTDYEINITEFNIFNLTNEKKNWQIQQFESVIMPFSQVVVDIFYEFFDFSFDFLLLSIFYRSNSQNVELKIPLPNTINKIIDWKFVSETMINDQWGKKNKTLTSNFMKINQKFIESLIDFQRFFPELCEIESKKLKTFLNLKKKISGIFSIENNQYLIRIIMNENKEISFQIASYENENKNFLENIMRSFIFIFCL